MIVRTWIVMPKAQTSVSVVWTGWGPESLICKSSIAIHGADPLRCPLVLDPNDPDEANNRDIPKSHILGMPVFEISTLSWTIMRKMPSYCSRVLYRFDIGMDNTISMKVAKSIRNTKYLRFVFMSSTETTEDLTHEFQQIRFGMTVHVLWRSPVLHPFWDEGWIFAFDNETEKR